MAEYITSCGRCGSRKFTVVEIYQWCGEVGDDGLLGCTNSLGGIDSIRCIDCGKAYATDCFAGIDFN